MDKLLKKTVLAPKKTKFKKFRGVSLKFSPINFFFLEIFKEKTVVLQSLQFAQISAKQLEACKQAINKKIKRQGRLKTKIFADRPVSKKPLEVRMGKGKGAVNNWVCDVVPGTNIFELSGIDKNYALSIFKKACSRLPIKVKIIF